MAKDGKFPAINMMKHGWPVLYYHHRYVIMVFFFFRFSSFFGRLSRGQPITTSSGKWLQLLLTISDVVDLSRFRFDLTYRVLPAAVSIASSNSSLSSYYGDPVPGTLCSRNLHSCDQRTCVIQSPNFPGLYPRFVSLFSFFFLVYVSKKERLSLKCVTLYIRFPDVMYTKKQKKNFFFFIFVGFCGTIGNNLVLPYISPESLLYKKILNQFRAHLIIDIYVSNPKKKKI